MSNNIDIIGLLEWVDRKKKTSDRSEARKPKGNPEMKDLITLLQERRNENAMIDNFFKDVEKLGKKDEEKKKKEWLKLSTEQIQMILLTSFMVTSPAWVWLMILYMGKH